VLAKRRASLVRPGQTSIACFAYPRKKFTEKRLSEVQIASLSDRLY
jgi:hypothetical protein